MQRRGISGLGKRWQLALLAAVLLLACLPAAVWAGDEIPILPTFVTGQVIRNDSQIPSSGTVRAYVDGELRGDQTIKSNGQLVFMPVVGSSVDADKPVFFSFQPGDLELTLTAAPAVRWISGDTDSWNNEVFTYSAPSVAVLPVIDTAACGQYIQVNLSAPAIFQPEFQLWVQSSQDGSWSSLGDYSGTATYNITKQVPGTYKLMAFAKSQGAPYSAAITSPLVNISFTKRSAVRALTVSGPNGAQPIGSNATFTATATDDGGTPLYQFWLHDSAGWRVVRNYDTNNTYTLSNLQLGSYVIAVYALDQADINAGNWSAAYYQVFILNVGSSLELTAPSSVSNGETVQVEATATGITGCEYQFWYQAPDSSWHQSGGYSTSGLYSFPASQAGTYKVIAFAKDHYAPATDQFAVTADKFVNSNPS